MAWLLNIHFNMLCQNTRVIANAVLRRVHTWVLNKSMFKDEGQSFPVFQGTHDGSQALKSIKGFVQVFSIIIMKSLSLVESCYLWGYPLMLKRWNAVLPVNLLSNLLANKSISLLLLSWIILLIYFTYIFE